MNPDPSAQVLPSATQVALPGVPALEVGMHTDPGRDPNKQVNEDALMARETPHGHLAVVCDGMGGHVGGREASHLAIETIFRTVDATPPGTPAQQVLRDALFQANAAVYARGQQSPELKGMGSTCVAVLTHQAGTDVAHVGDSRVYLLTQGQVYQVTKDHSLVQRLVDANMLTPEQAANHPNANQITNAFGQRPDVEVEVRPQPFPHTPGDAFILCSDGLSDEVGPQDILQVLAPHPPLDQAARALVDLANARGGHDNITVILVRVAGGAPFAVAAPLPFTAAAAATATATTAEMEILRPEQVQAAAQTTTVAALPASPPNAPQFTPPPAYSPTPIEVPPRKSGKGVIVAVVVVLLLVVAGVAAAVVLRGRANVEKTEKTPVESPSEEPTPAPKSSAKEIKPAPVPSEEPTPEPSAKPHPRPSAGAPSSTSLDKEPPPPPTVKPPAPKPSTPSEWTK